jgi:hypothetical protein
MDDFTDRLADHDEGGTATQDRPTPEQLAAERACDELLARIETAATRALDGARHAHHAHTDDDALLAELVREYAGCARAAGMRPEQMVKPLKVAMSRFFYDRRERADALLRLAILGYFEIAS